MGLPVEINPLLISSSGYVVGRSLRFRSSASAYLNRTPASNGNSQKFTWSGWVKRGALSVLGDLFSAGTGDNNRTLAFFQSDNTLIFGSNNSGTYYGTVTTAVFRDPSAWYHIVFSIDTTQTTTANRVRIYINNVEQTATSAWNSGYIPQNTTTYINTTSPQVIGANPTYGVRDYYDGYLAEVNLIDGQQLTPSSFGAYDTNGVWQPLKYGGTYGTNGFYLPFSNTTSTTTLVQDSSGNGNNWTPNNISLTAGTTYDSMIDSPTVSASSSNYAVMNPNFVTPSTTFSNGNLTLTKTGATDVVATSTIAMPSGKWYWEITITSLSASSDLGIGIVKNTTTNGSWVGALPAGVYFNSGSGVYRYGSNITGTLGTTFATNDILGLALDMDAGTLALYKNNTLIYTVSGVDTTTPHYAFWDSYANGESASLNFGQRPFTYTPPTGYSALNTYNLPTPTIKNGAQYMAATTYTGTGATQSISNGSNNTIGTTFQPDLIWGKQRNGASSNVLTDSVRGTNSQLSSNLTNAQDTQTDVVTAFNSNGFTVGASAGFNMNQSGSTLVAWQWKAGGSGVSNTAGTITSTVSANTTAGFSVVTYTGNSLTNQTVGHGLGVAPSMIIIKNRDSAYDWIVGHTSTSFNGYLYLNSTGAYVSSSNPFNNTAPTSTVFTIAGNAANPNVNLSTTKYVAYCFAAVRGYSAFGSYTGNGSTDGPFVYLGFRPRFVLIRRSNNTGYWLMKDSSRNGYNQTDPLLYANVSDAEYAAAGAIDILSNGFKVRASNLEINGSGDTLIYAAFAENPFNYSRAR